LISKMSPADTPSAFIESESTRATLLPTSREYASNILSEISFWLMNSILHVTPLYLCYFNYLQIV